jgi:hypothetical protein
MPPAKAAAIRRWAGAFPWWWLPFLLLGTALRVFHLRQQVLEGDELHAVRAAASASLGAILGAYREADICIPLTALDRALMDAGCRLSEMGFRLPSVLAGAGALLLLPRLAAGRLGRGGAGLYACLLAVSPLLVFYSRIARPYMPMTLAALLAVAAFSAWWRTGAWRFAAVYVVAAALAVWLHLAAAPFVAAPFLCAAVDVVVPAAARGKRPPPPSAGTEGQPGSDAGRPSGRGRARRLGQLFLLGLALLAACAAFLLPASRSLAEIVAAKREAQAVPWQTWADVLVLQAGTARPALAVLFWALALAGLARLLAVARGLAASTLALAAAQVLGVRLLSPLGLADPVTLDRYLLPVLPLALLWVAAALALPWRREGRAGRSGRWLAAAGFVLALAAGGPLADRVLWRSSFMHHYDFVAFFTPRPVLSPEEVPAFYGDLAAAPGRRPIVEYPWHPFVELRSLYLYQQIHGRRVIVSGPQKQLAAPGLALRNFVPPSPEAVCASGARYLVVHLHIAREEDRVGGPSMGAEVRQGLRGQGVDLAGQLALRWGEPAYADRDLRVWDLDRACGRGAASARGAGRRR